MTGRKLGNYQLLEEIGRGGMGRVYKARDTRLDRIVAVKVLTISRIDDDSRRRFLQEAKAVSALNDPGIVTLHDIGSDEEVDFLVMEYVEGSTLKSVIPAEGLPLRAALKYAEKIARALASAHAVGIIHRDLKPGNIVVKPTGELKVLDFGIAKLVAADAAGDDTKTAFTQAGLSLGTPAYMSPEQVIGAAVDHRSDIFSLGILLYEMLSGRRPFTGAHALALVHAIHHDEPAPISPPPPESVTAILARALAKDPGQRYQSMRELAGDLRLAVHNLDAGVMNVAPAQTSSQRPGVVRILGSVAVIFAIAFGGWIYWGKAKGKPLPEAGAPPAHESVLQARQLMNRADIPANVEKAIEILRTATESHTDHAAAHASLALVLIRSNGGNPDPSTLQEAKDQAEQAVSLDPQLALAHVARGGYFFAARQYPEAEKELVEAIKLDPGNGQAHLLLAAMYYYHKRNLEKSQQEYQEAVRLQPDDFEARYGLAALHYHRGDYKSAERESLAAVSLAPDSPRPHQMLGSMYYVQGKLEAATREYQKALEIQPTATVYSNLGTVYFFRAMYGQSAAVFEKATRMQPQKYLYWGNLGDAYRWIPEERQKSNEAYDKAIHLAREELKTNPEDLEIRSRLSMMLAKRGEGSAARQEIQRVEQSKSERTGPIHYRNAIAHEVLGDRNGALAALGLAIRANYPIDEIQRDPELKDLRFDERYARLLQSAKPK